MRRRYPADGGGLSARGRVQRERVRLEAARLYEQGVRPAQVARRLRVSTKSAYQWRRRWRAGGDTALASKGPGGATCRLTETQLDRLRAELARGPAEHGWADQRWTLARITGLIGRLFHVRYTLRGTSYLLHRIGLSVQVPARRAAERDEAAITMWRTETWATVRG
jgi:transposase